MFRVLFVCMGNICRSPTAEGVFKAMVASEGLDDRIESDSAGTHGYHIGSPPDHRTIAVAKARGYDLTPLRARRVGAGAGDFSAFDLVLAMDSENRATLQRLCPATHKDRLKLFLEFAPDLNDRDVPDPYYGNRDRFEHVLDLAEMGSKALIQAIRQKLAP
jgi:protein-tyrosine phosphatase